MDTGDNEILYIRMHILRNIVVEAEITTKNNS